MKINPSNFKWLLENLATIAQLALVVVGIVYTVETRNMRLVVERQLDSQIELARLGYKPIVMPLIVDIDGMQRMSRISASELPDDEKTKMLDSIAKSSPRFTARVRNYSKSEAYSLRGVFYDVKTKSFLRSARLTQVMVDSEDPAEWPSGSEYTTKEQVLAWLEGEYGVDMEALEPHIVAGGRNYILVVYMDRNNNFYFSKKAFSVDKNGTIWQQWFKSDILPIDVREYRDVVE